MLLSLIKMSCFSIMYKKGRSILTMLGIIVGVVAITVCLSLTEGISNGVVREVGEMSDTYFDTYLYTKYPALSMEKVEEIRDSCQNISALSINEGGITDVEFGTKKEQLKVYGISSDYQKVNSIRMEYGRLLKEEDVSNESFVAVLSYSAAVGLNEDVSNLCGKTIYIMGIAFKIVGVSEKNMGLVSFGDILIPYTVYVNLTGIKEITGLQGTTYSADDFNAGIQQLNEKLLEIYGSQEMFSINPITSIADATDNILLILNFLMFGVASISLVVGGIGIMNIMMVSVSERTREIGIRKAIGAENREIMLMFLFEAILICFIGNILGIVLSGAIIQVLCLIGGAFELTFRLSLSTVLYSIGFTSIIGVVFGITPAYRAARLIPVIALKVE
jgi:putative ABC transport system permease protein